MALLLCSMTGKKKCLCWSRRHHRHFFVLWNLTWISVEIYTPHKWYPINAFDDDVDDGDRNSSFYANAKQELSHKKQTNARRKKNRARERYYICIQSMTFNQTGCWILYYTLMLSTRVINWRFYDSIATNGYKSVCALCGSILRSSSLSIPFRLEYKPSQQHTWTDIGHHILTAY